MLVSNGNLSPGLAGSEKFVELPMQDVISATAWTQLKDVKERKKKLCVAKVTRTKNPRVLQKCEALEDGTSSKASHFCNTRGFFMRVTFATHNFFFFFFFLTVWKRDEKRNQMERCTIENFGALRFGKQTFSRAK